MARVIGPSSLNPKLVFNFEFPTWAVVRDLETLKVEWPKHFTMFQFLILAPKDQAT